MPMSPALYPVPHEVVQAYYLIHLWENGYDPVGAGWGEATQHILQPGRPPRVDPRTRRVWEGCKTVLYHRRDAAGIESATLERWCRGDAPSYTHTWWDKGCLEAARRFAGANWQPLEEHRVGHWPEYLRLRKPRGRPVQPHIDRTDAAGVVHGHVGSKGNRLDFQLHPWHEKFQLHTKWRTSSWANSQLIFDDPEKAATWCVDMYQQTREHHGAV